MKEKKTLNRSTPRGLTPTPLIEVQTSFGAQPENGHVKGDYSDTLLDNWAIIELANADAKRRERFVKALKSCGSLLFSFTNSIELGEAEGEPAERVRTFLDEIGANWIPIELNPWTVMDREITGQTNLAPCISTLFMETFVKDRM